MSTIEERYIAENVAIVSTQMCALLKDVPFVRAKSHRFKPLDEIPIIGAQQEYITRDQVRLILGGISLMTVARLDRSGKLKGVQLNRISKSTEYKSTSKKLYKKTDVIALADKLRKRD
jgi:hypothetical protein